MIKTGIKNRSVKEFVQSTNGIGKFIHKLKDSTPNHVDLTVRHFQIISVKTVNRKHVRRTFTIQFLAFPVYQLFLLYRLSSNRVTLKWKRKSQVTHPHALN